MKKTIITLVLLTLCSVGFAQEIEIIDNAYSEVVTCKGNANTIHGAVKAWASKSFKDITKTLKLDDPKNHKLVFKCIIYSDEIKYMGENNVDFFGTITIDSRDGRFRIKIEDIEVETTRYGMGDVPKPVHYSYDSFKAFVDKGIKDYADSNKKLQELKNNPDADYTEVMTAEINVDVYKEFLKEKEDIDTLKTAIKGLVNLITKAVNSNDDEF